MSIGAIALGKLSAVRVPGLLHPVWLRGGTTDINVFHQIFVRGDLETIERDTNARFVVDAGAYTGLSSIWLSRWFPNACVAAIELEPGNYEVLVRNTAHCSRIIPINKALWSHRGKVRLVNDTGHKWSYYAVDTTGKEDSGGIDALCVNDLLLASGMSEIDLMKVDIEGGEKVVFETAGGWIKKVKALAIELHDRRNPGVIVYRGAPCTL